MKPFTKRAVNNILLTAFGTLELNWKTTITFVLLLFPLAWIPDGIGNLLDSPPKYFLGTIQLIFSFLIILIFTFIAKHYKIESSQIMDVQVEESKSAKGLILFLSYNSKHKDCLMQNSIDDISNNYKMPLVALRHHADSLQKVVVIASSESFREYAEFYKVVEKFLPEIASKLSLHSKKDLDFEDAETIYDTLSSVYNEMKIDIKNEKDIFIDVTGGQKIISIVGAIFALPLDRNIQYVSSTNYKVKRYDIRYNRQ